jgi:hypothetical protein
MVYEVAERKNGQDTVVARRFDGLLTTRVPGLLLLPAGFFGVDLMNQRIGSRETKAAFYRSTLGIDLNRRKITDANLAASLRQLLTLIEMSHDYHYGHAVTMFHQLVEQGDPDQDTISFPFVHALIMNPKVGYFSVGRSIVNGYPRVLDDSPTIDRLLASDTREDQIFGLMRLGDFEGRRLAPKYRSVVLAALESSDPMLVFAGLMAISYKNPQDRAFAEAALARVAEAPDPLLKWPLMQALGQDLPDL